MQSPTSLSDGLVRAALSDSRVAADDILLPAPISLGKAFDPNYREHHAAMFSADYEATLCVFTGYRKMRGETFISLECQFVAQLIEHRGTPPLPATESPVFIHYYTTCVKC